MLLSLLPAALALFALAGPAVAQIPPNSGGSRVLESHFGKGVTIEYKENNLCETREGVKSYSGYVRMPPGTADLAQGQDYPINTFFWLFEARNDPHNAPLTIWQDGGPGGSSMYSVLGQIGPCRVNVDSNPTRPANWSWNENMNLIFIDNPVQVGFSYDTLHNETYDLVSERRTVLEDGAPVPEQNATFLTGRSSSGDIRSTASGSVNGAIASWHFLQTWFQEFPQYLPNDTRISLAAMSYGGRYGPAMMSFWEEQNSRIENGTWDDGERQPTILYLDTLMLFNGCIDRFTEYPHYPSQASRGNGYGIEAVNETTYQGMVEAVPECLKRLRSCHDVAAILDPENTGINAAVSAVCRSADDFCLANIMGPGFLSGRHPSDLSVIPQTHGSAPSLIRSFLNRDWVQRELGASRNWTEISGAVYNAFISMSDMPRNTGLEDLAYLLNNGIKVSLVHGDLDFLCPWQGGDAVAKAINWTGSAGYASAQYADLQTNDDYSGGLVRQYGNLSYIRAYRAGHGVPYAQRETAYKIFERALFNLDIATGTQSTAGSIEAAYRSTGRDVMDVQLSLPTTSPD